jgi:hypothetical protein
MGLNHAKLANYSHDIFTISSVPRAHYLQRIVNTKTKIIFSAQHIIHVH